MGAKWANSGARRFSSRSRNTTSATLTDLGYRGAAYSAKLLQTALTTALKTSDTIFPPSPGYIRPAMARPLEGLNATLDRLTRLCRSKVAAGEPDTEFKILHGPMMLSALSGMF